MKKQMIFIGISILCLGLLFACSKQTENPALAAFRKVLAEEEFSCEDNSAKKQTVMESGTLEEIYTEEYDFDNHTFTVVFLHRDASEGTFSATEYLYAYGKDQFAVNLYSSEEAQKNGKPDRVYFLNQEDMLEPVGTDTPDVGEDDEIADETVLYGNAVRVRQVFEDYLKKANLTVEELIG